MLSENSSSQHLMLSKIQGKLHLKLTQNQVQQCLILKQTINSLQKVLNVIREFIPNSKSYSENSVQIVLLEHSALSIIRVNREFKPKKTCCYQKIQSKKQQHIMYTNNSVQVVLKLVIKFSPNSTKCYQATYNCDGVANYIVCCFLVFETGIWHLRHGNQEPLHHDY